MKPEILKKGKCPKCKMSAWIVLYRGEKKIDHQFARDTKECRKIV